MKKKRSIEHQLTDWQLLRVAFFSLMENKRHFLYSAVTVEVPLFQYFPSSRTASGLLCTSMVVWKWQTGGRRPLTYCMYHSRQMMLLSRILSFTFSRSPLNDFHLGDVNCPS